MTTATDASMSDVDVAEPVSGEWLRVTAVADNATIASSRTLDAPTRYETETGPDIIVYQGVDLNSISNRICLLALEGARKGGEQTYRIVDIDGHPRLLRSERGPTAHAWDACLAALTGQSDTETVSMLGDRVMLAIDYEPDGRLWTPVYTEASDRIGFEAIGSADDLLPSIA